MTIKQILNYLEMSPQNHISIGHYKDCSPELITVLVIDDDGIPYVSNSRIAMSWKQLFSMLMNKQIYFKVVLKATFITHWEDHIKCYAKKWRNYGMG